jgi:hypothetical protein
MKKLVVIILIFVLVSCSGNPFINGVEQHFDKDCKGITPSGRAFVTYVWYNGEIAAYWYDDIYSVNDSLVAARKKQGNELLHALSSGN